MPKNRLNIQRSEFLSFLERVDDHQGLEDLIRLYKKKYNTARHVCWGAVIEEKGTYLEQSSDGQEPRGTAGPQILAQIKSNHLHNVVVIVVRASKVLILLGKNSYSPRKSVKASKSSQAGESPKLNKFC